MKRRTILTRSNFAGFTDVELGKLFQETVWSDITQNERIISTYNGFSTLGLLMAHALPYLLPIPSERALARELAEREFLRGLCGFGGGDGKHSTPSRPTLWHFRKRHDEFNSWLLQVLVTLTIQGRNLEIEMPFRSDPPQRGQFDKESYQLTAYNAKVEIWTTRRDFVSSRDDPYQIVLPFPDLDLTSSGMAARLGLADEIGLPAEVRVTYQQGPPTVFGIAKPSWLYVDLQLKDRLVSLGPAHTSTPYTACNLLLVRNTGGREEVLLSRRLSGYGVGKLAMPGGKKDAQETVWRCAERELKEETGLRLVNARPVSLRYNSRPGSPDVTVKSIGLLVRKGDYEGGPRRREEHIHSEWEWYDLKRVLEGEELFEPTKMVLQDYLSRLSFDLTWDQVEEALPLWRDLKGQPQP